MYICYIVYRNAYYTRNIHCTEWLAGSYAEAISYGQTEIVQIYVYYAIT